MMSNWIKSRSRFLRHILHRFNGAGRVIYVVKCNERKETKMGCFFYIFLLSAARLLGELACTATPITVYIIAV